MTNEEAIKTLHELWRTTNDPWYEKVYEMAINALTAQEQLANDSPELDKENGELISRQAAIDALRTCYDTETVTMDDGDEYINYGYAIGEIEQLPSAQPEIVRCGSCKYAEIADARDNQDGYTCQFHRGSIWFSGSYCSWAERRTDG